LKHTTIVNADGMDKLMNGLVGLSKVTGRPLVYHIMHPFQPTFPVPTFQKGRGHILNEVHVSVSCKGKLGTRHVITHLHAPFCHYIRGFTTTPTNYQIQKFSTNHVHHLL